MSDSLKLTTAIEANKNGLDSMRRYRDRLEAEREKIETKLNNLTNEIEAREGLEKAMLRLQAVLPPNETIQFVVPYTWSD